MEGFAEGYSFFEKNSGSYTAAAMLDIMHLFHFALIQDLPCLDW